MHSLHAVLPGENPFGGGGMHEGSLGRGITRNCQDVLQCFLGALERIQQELLAARVDWLGLEVIFCCPQIKGAISGAGKF